MQIYWINNFSKIKSETFEVLGIFPAGIFTNSIIKHEVYLCFLRR